MTASDAAGRQPLPVELHAATRGEHAALNRSIIARLPLCLPHATSTSRLYAQGITVFSQIYYGFEEAWDTLLAQETLSQEQRNLLIQLHIPELRRAKRLDVGFQRMSMRMGKSFDVQHANLRSATLHFQEDIRKAILARPHLLMAYTWTMYLALFNGGRFIAKQLLNAGSLFWNNEDRATTAQNSLAFWFFGEGEEYDGEDIKVAFKQRFHMVSETLSPLERDEIIEESKRLFATCMEMVAFLDRHVQSGESQLQPLAAPIQSSSDRSSMFGYLTSLTPHAMTSFWQSIANVIPSTRNFHSISLPQEIEQQHG